MSDPSSSCVFVDTNCFLHAQPVAQIPWPQIAQTEHVDLVVCKDVIRELDDKKTTGSTSRIRDRARAALALIESCFDVEGGQLAEGVRLVVAPPPEVDWKSLGLQAEKTDDCLVATAYRYQQTNEDPVLLVTIDVGPRITAKSLGVPAATVPNEYRLRDDRTELEKENTRLRAAIQRQEAAIPKLEVAFHPEGTNYHKIVLPAERDYAKLAELETQRHRQELRPDQPEDVEIDWDQLQSLSAIAVGGRRSEQRRQDRYFEQYEEWVTSRLKHEDLRACFVPLGLRIRNGGGGPASSLDLRLEIPVDWLYREYFDDPPDPPSLEPSGAPSYLDMARSISPIRSLNDLIGSNVGEVYDEVVGDIRILRTSVKLIKHHQAETVQLGFAGVFEPGTSATLPYELHAAELREPIRGDLHVIVESEQGDRG